MPDTSCELCGFDFENRKALASHARAHLRQLGIVEWKADGATSPIELLSELIRKDPAKIAAITRRYRMGDLYIKKVGRNTGLIWIWIFMSHVLNAVNSDPDPREALRRLPCPRTLTRCPPAP